MKINLFTLIFFFQVLNTCNTKAQSILISADSSYRYYAATNEPPSDWYMPGFNDASWTVGTGVIEFGYDAAEPYVQIDHSARSLYLRYKFTISNKAGIKKVNFFADFDDGYIAYLNGKEILRKNISFGKKYPAYNDSTERSHESEFFHNTTYPVLGYYLDSLLLDSCLFEGENNLAVHVLNDSLMGSDLLYMMYLVDMTDGDYDYYNYEYRYKALYHVDSSDFPLVIINTDEFGIPYKNIKTKAFMGIVDNGSGNYNKPSDPFNVYSGDISIELRGQSSADFPKQSYRLTTIDAFENDSSVALLGMPKENDWILFGPFHDKSQFRNKMVYDLGHKLGAYQPRSRFCEVILNGDLIGLYCLTENIKRDKNRVDISKLKETDISGKDVTGGYIVKWDKNDQNAQEFQIVYPKSDLIKPEQTSYINSFFRDYNSVLSDTNFTDPVNGFRKYISDSSFVDFIIMNEITKNADAYIFSTYLFKDREDKDNRLKFGPLWDYDLAFGNTLFQEGNLTHGWQFDYSWRSPLRITRLFQDENLVLLFRNRWHELRQGLMRTDSIYAFIDNLVNTIQEPVERNYLVWPVIDEELFYPNYVSRSYNEEVDIIKNWLGERLQWMDDNIDDLYYPVSVNPVQTKLPSVIINVYPNPFSTELYMLISSENATKFRVELSNLLGQVQFVENVSVVPGNQEIKLNNTKFEDLPAGIFVLRILKNDRLIDLRKVVKK